MSANQPPNRLNPMSPDWRNLAEVRTPTMATTCSFTLRSAPTWATVIVAPVGLNRLTLANPAVHPAR
jgi:hypothetical protein